MIEIKKGEKNSLTGTIQVITNNPEKIFKKNNTSQIKNSTRTKENLFIPNKHN
jgi:hypothetical protein